MGPVTHDRRLIPVFLMAEWCWQTHFPEENNTFHINCCVTLNEPSTFNTIQAVFYKSAAISQKIPSQWSARHKTRWRPKRLKLLGLHQNTQFCIIYYFRGVVHNTVSNFLDHQVCVVSIFIYVPVTQRPEKNCLVRLRLLMLHRNGGRSQYTDYRQSKAVNGQQPRGIEEWRRPSRT